MSHLYPYGELVHVGARRRPLRDALAHRPRCRPRPTRSGSVAVMALVASSAVTNARRGRSSEAFPGSST